MKPYQPIADHYQECFNKHGDTSKGWDWPNPEDMLTRYKVMADILGDEKCSVLDFGCGNGDFFRYLKLHKPNAHYTGIDINRSAIDLCIKKYGHNFQQIDILTNPLTEIYDFIIINGVFTVKKSLSFDDMFTFFKNIITTLSPYAVKGIAFNTMSKHVDWERDDLFHLPFDVMAKFLKEQVSRNFVIRNDYGLYEYTTYVYKS